MQLSFAIIHIIVSVLLIIAIMLQNKGAGLGQAFGGDSSIYSARRGPEKALFTLTIILAILFIGISVVNIILPR